jgi:hypothetical protein
VATDITIRASSSQVSPSAGINDNIMRCVESQEKLERLTPRAIYLVVVGIPFLLSVVGAGEIDANVLFTTALAYIAARLLIWAVRGSLVQPSRRIRFERAATKLRNYLHGSDPLALGPYSWTYGSPGAVAISQAGEITVADRSTGYHLLRILPQQVASVKVEREARHITHTRHSGATTLGAFGKGFGVAQTFGGRSTSVTETVEQFFLEICYQLQKNGAVSTVVVPCGPVRRDAEELCMAIERLEA